MPPTGPQDPKVLAVVKAIRQVETGGDYENRTGDHGSSAGAYQWNNDNKPLAPNELPSHWKNAAGEFLGNPNAPMTRENQNFVAYHQVKKYKDEGLSPLEIDAIWNGAHKDLNGKYVHNAPDRAAKFQQALAQEAGGQQLNPALLPPAAQPNQSPQQMPGMPFLAQAAGGQAQIPDTGAGYPTQGNGGFFDNLQQDLAGTNQTSYKDQAVNAVKGVGNFLFPIVGDVYHDVKGDNKKTALQQGGDLALSALPFIPGLGVAGKAAEGAGALAKLRALPAVVKGAGVGYGAGVASNLSQGQDVGEAIQPGVSTLGGAALGGAGGALATKLHGISGEEAAINKMRTAYEDALGATKTGIRAGSKVSARGGESAPEFLAHAGLPPETAEINGRVVFTTGEDSATYKAIQDRASALTHLRDSLIDTAPADATKLTSLTSLQNTVLKKVNEDFLGTDRITAENHIIKEFDELRKQLGDTIDLKKFNEVKKYFQGNTNYDATRPTTVTKANELAAKLSRKEVERLAEKAGVPGVKAINKIIQDHLDFLNTDGRKGILHKLNGQVVKGGRIGIHAQEVIGAAAGNRIGSLLGGGIPGEIGGMIAGGIAGNQVSKLMQRLSVGGPRMAATVGKMAQEDPKIIQQLAAELEKRTGRASGLIAPNVVPKAKTSVMSDLMTKAAARTGGGL